MIVFFDLETAGLRVEHPIIQIGAVAMDRWREVDAFECKVAFDLAQADPEPLKVNHWTAEAWREAKPEREAVQAFKAFLDRHRSVELISKRTGAQYSVARVGGHNVTGFDFERIARLFKRHSTFLPMRFTGALDTWHGAAWYFERNPPAPADFKLATLAERLGIATGTAHDALSDARTSAAIARRLLA